MRRPNASSLDELAITPSARGAGRDGARGPDPGRAPLIKRARRAGRRLRELVGPRVGRRGRRVLGFLWSGSRAGFRPDAAVRPRRGGEAPPHRVAATAFELARRCPVAIVAPEEPARPTPARRTTRSSATSSHSTAARGGRRAPTSMADATDERRCGAPLKPNRRRGRVAVYAHSASAANACLSLARWSLACGNVALLMNPDFLVCQ